MTGRPRFPDAIPPLAASVTEKGLANEAVFETALQTWLSDNGDVDELCQRISGSAT
jgi:hypothetical protein